MGSQFGSPLWRDGFLSVNGSQSRIRGSVNGNVLVPTAEERTPLTTDPVLRRFVERILAAYPAELPNRTDISPHALNTNAPQSIDTDDATIRLDQMHEEDRFTAQYHFTNQKVTGVRIRGRPESRHRHQGAHCAPDLEPGVERRDHDEFHRGLRPRCVR